MILTRNLDELCEVASRADCYTLAARACGSCDGRDAPIGLAAADTVHDGRGGSRYEAIDGLVGMSLLYPSRRSFCASSLEP